MHPTTQALLDALASYYYHTTSQGPNPFGALEAARKARQDWENAGCPDTKTLRNGWHVVERFADRATVRHYDNGNPGRDVMVSSVIIGARAVVMVRAFGDAVDHPIRILDCQDGGPWLDTSTGVTCPTLAEWLTHPTTLDLL